MGKQVRRDGTPSTQVVYVYESQLVFRKDPGLRGGKESRLKDKQLEARNELAHLIDPFPISISLSFYLCILAVKVCRVHGSDAGHGRT